MDGSRSTYSERSSVYRVTLGKRAGKRRLGRMKRRWRIILKYVLNKSALKGRTLFVWLTVRARECSCEYSDTDTGVTFLRRIFIAVKILAFQQGQCSRSYLVS
jgi:hypothetical protein